MEDANTSDLDIREWADRRGENGFVEIPDEAEGSSVIDTGERAPKVERTKLSDRAKAFIAERRGDADRQAGKKTIGPKRAPRVRASHPRVSVAGIIGWGWSMLAKSAGGYSLPVARTMAIQAPVAGEVLEDVVKGTLVDRLLQPIARVGEGGEAVFAILGPPVLVGIMHKNPNTVPALEPVLREALMTWVSIAGPKLEEKAAKAAEFREKYGDTVDNIMAGIFEGLGDTDEALQYDSPFSRVETVTVPFERAQRDGVPMAFIPEPTPVEEPSLIPTGAPMARPINRPAPTSHVTRVPPVKRAPAKKAPAKKVASA